MILKATDEVDGSCKLESDILNGPDERVRPSLYCFSKAIRDGQRRIPGMMSCYETSLTSIHQVGDVLDSGKASLGRIKDDFDGRMIAKESTTNFIYKFTNLKAFLSKLSSAILKINQRKRRYPLARPLITGEQGQNED